MPARARGAGDHDSRSELSDASRADARRDPPRLSRRSRARTRTAPTRSSCRRSSPPARSSGSSACPRDRIAICPPGAPDWTPRPAAPTDGYVLFFGTLEPRKNVGGLLDAYERLHRPSRPTRSTPTPELVLAGRADRRGAAVARSHRRGRRCRTRAPHRLRRSGERRALYEGARLLVQPSFDEGFGMPVLEAMTLGVPVVAANRGSLPEVLGDAGPLVDPDQPADIARRDRARAERRRTTPRRAPRRASPARARSAGTRPRAACTTRISTAIERRGAQGPLRLAMRIGIDARELCGRVDRRRPLSRRPAVASGPVPPAAPMNSCSTLRRRSRCRSMRAASQPALSLVPAARGGSRSGFPAL